MTSIKQTLYYPESIVSDVNSIAVKLRKQGKIKSKGENKEEEEEKEEVELNVGDVIVGDIDYFWLHPQYPTNLDIADRMLNYRDHGSRSYDIRNVGFLITRIRRFKFKTKEMDYAILDVLSSLSPGTTQTILMSLNHDIGYAFYKMKL